MSSDIDDAGDAPTEFEGYSDYQTVSQSIARSIDNAVEAYVLVQSRHSEGARMNADTAAEAASHILGAAMKILPELEANAKSEEETDDSEEELYTEILASWQGDEGYIELLKQAQLVNECPDWLHDFVYEIRRAGFHLGYLKAGREKRTETPDWVEGKVEDMFDT